MQVLPCLPSFALADHIVHLQVININLKVCWILSQAAGQHMVPLRRGKIINMCSLLTFQGGVTVPAYAAAKGALGQLTRALSNEWSQHNVQVNGICPGYIATDMSVGSAFELLNFRLYHLPPISPLLSPSHFFSFRCLLDDFWSGVRSPRAIDSHLFFPLVLFCRSRYYFLRVLCHTRVKCVHGRLCGQLWAQRTIGRITPVK